MSTITMEAEGVLFGQPLKLTLTAFVHASQQPYYAGGVHGVLVTYCNSRWRITTSAPDVFESDGGSWIEVGGKTLQEALDHFAENVNAVKLWAEQVGRERDESHVK